MNRDAHLDGLRGLAALTVYFGHLLISLFPRVITMEVAGNGHAGAPIIGLTPLAVTWNGNFGVCIFFVLSGFVLSNFCDRTRISFPAQLTRRYLRLALPMLITSTFAWAILVGGLYANGTAAQITGSGWLQGWYRFPADVINMSSEALYGAFADGSNTYNPNLWTMRIELTGSVYVFALFALFDTSRARLAAAIMFAFYHQADYFVLFAVGAVLYEGRDFVSRIGAGRPVGAGIVAASGVLLGSITAIRRVIGEDWLALHHAPAFAFEFVRSPLLWVTSNAEPLHRVGAVALFIGVLASSRLQRHLGSPACAYLGRISFVLYLLHIPILCSVGAWVMVELPPNMSYPLRALVCAVVTTMAVVGTTVLINGFVDVRMTEWSRRAGRWIDELGRLAARC